MQYLQAFLADLQMAPKWVQVWVGFMGLIFTLAIPFAFTRLEARWALAVMALSLPAMVALHSAVGFVRLLGVVHVVIWTPFVVYLWRRRDLWRVRGTLSGKWIVTVFTTMIVSLIFDYADVVRWLLGERG